MAEALLDTNVIVHASYRASRLFTAAAALVDRGLREAGHYCIAPQVLIEFAAVATRKRFVAPPLPTSEVERISRRLYESRRLIKIYPKRATVMRAIQDGAALGLVGPVWYDVFLAATMRDAGVQVVITDNLADFEQIPFVTAVHIEDAV